jgi:hypothetical protein
VYTFPAEDEAVGCLIGDCSGGLPNFCPKMGCTRCFTGSLLHILNLVDLVLGGSVLLFGLLLPLHW